MKNILLILVLSMSFISFSQKLNGLQKKYFENGQLNYKINYKNDKRDGLYVEYFENGNLAFKVNYKNDKKEGSYERYNSTSQLEFLAFKANYKNGELDGLLETYYENGSVEARTNYKNGKRDGLSALYYENGKLDNQASYKNGKLDGLFARYYENGQLHFNKNYKNGKKDGLEEVYSRNGLSSSKKIWKVGTSYPYNPFIIEDTNIKNVNVYDLEAMIRLFLKDCELNYIKLLKDYKITSTFEALDKGVVALAFGIFNDEEIIIKVSPEEWSKASNPKRWYILYHELGHDILNLQHGQGGKMMFNFTEEDYTWDDFFKDKDYMFNYMKRE
tara:strand:- start:32 stop:1021 length:990 start_codon:yes stop_codon:yes gene_type:complete